MNTGEYLGVGQKTQTLQSSQSSQASHQELVVIVPPTLIFIKKGGRNDGGHLIRLGPLTPRSALDSSSAGYCDRAARGALFDRKGTNTSANAGALQATHCITNPWRRRLLLTTIIVTVFNGTETTETIRRIACNEILKTSSSSLFSTTTSENPLSSSSRLG